MDKILVCIIPSSGNSQPDFATLESIFDKDYILTVKKSLLESHESDYEDILDEIFQKAEQVSSVRLAIYIGQSWGGPCLSRDYVLGFHKRLVAKLDKVRTILAARIFCVLAMDEPIQELSKICRVGIYASASEFKLLAKKRGDQLVRINTQAVQQNI